MGSAETHGHDLVGFDPAAERLTDQGRYYL
jgi:hypothetical protein